MSLISLMLCSRYYETSSANGTGVYDMFNDLLTAVIEKKLTKPKHVIVADSRGK